MKTLEQLKSERLELKARLRDVNKSIDQIRIDDFCREKDISIGDRILVRNQEMEVTGFSARFSFIEILAAKIKKDGTLYANSSKVWRDWTKK